MQAWSIAGSLLAALSGVMLCLALFTDYWLVAYGPKDTGHSGLWQECWPVCQSPAPVQAYIQATRAFIILAFLASLVVAGSLLVPITACVRSPANLSLTASVAAFAAACCTIIAMSAFTAESWNKNQAPDVQLTFEWSFYLGWAALPLLLLSGVFAIVIHTRHAGYEQM
ncbi:protein NKG7-like [Emydura macquarii macquarii]|uniref:protein NKG7-like n=1 Tax=Emydura macquarii macquarii TaxID=1129001 RepID=UPI00352AF6FB